MIRVSKRWQEMYACVRLYKEDMREIVEAAKTSGQTVRIVAGEYVLSDIGELEKMKGQGLKSFEVHVGMHELCVVVGWYGAIVGVEDAESVQLRGIAAKIGNVLNRKKQWYGVFFRPVGAVGMAVMVGMVVGAAGGSYLGTGWSLLLGGLAGLGVSASALRWLGRSVIMLMEMHDEGSFWQRNKDKVLVGVIVGVAGSVAGAVIAWIVRGVLERP